MRKENILKELKGEKSNIYYQVLQIVNAISGPARKEEIRNKKHLIKSKILNEIDKEPDHSRYRDLRIAFISVAATLVVIGFSLFFFIDRDSDKELKQVSQNIEMYSPFGLITKVTLPDGSKVTLNNNSRISYPISFSKAKREVTLSGEAYFDIQKEENRPFIVKSHGLDVRVLGTKFNVKSYKDHSETIVSLCEGSVQVMSDTDQTSMKLEPGDQLLLNRRNGDMNRSKVNTSLCTSWLGGHLLYRNQSLRYIFNDLENRFNVKIQCSDSQVLSGNYYVSFSHGETLEYIMDLLSYKRNWTYKKLKNDHEIIIEKRK